MSNNYNVDDIFKNLEGTFDTEEPKQGHQDRFLDKLKNEHKVVQTKSDNKLRNLWKPFLAIAASVVLLLTVFVKQNTEEETYDLASISPEMADTQDYFTSVISHEMAKLEGEKSEETISIVNDAIKRINLLETEYEALKADLEVSGNDKRVIYAMISNFQNRIDILQTVLLQIENVKQLKQQI